MAQKMVAAASELLAFVVEMVTLPVQLCLIQPAHLLSPETEVPPLLPFWEDSQDFQRIYFHLGKAAQE